jgi:hypothetical protein
VANQAELTVSDCTLSENTANGYGGGLFNAGPATVSDSTFSGNVADYVFGGVGGGMTNLAELTVSDCTFSDNTANGVGAGIFNYNVGTMTIGNTTIAGNLAAEGGGIFNEGTLTVSNSTFAENTAADPTQEGVGSGGAIWTDGTLTISNVTISGNSAAAGGGGIVNASGGTLLMVNSIVAGNSAGPNGIDPDIDGAVVAVSANNLIGDGDGLSGISNGDTNENQVGSSINPINPLLGPLGDNGGSTQTMPLLVGSPALAVGGAVTYLADPVSDATSTTISVQNAAAIAGTPGEYFILIDGEELEVTDVDLLDNTLTVVRGVNDTAAIAHSSGAAVYLATDQRGLPRSAMPDLGAFQSGQPTLTLGPAVLPVATVGLEYRITLDAAGGSGNYRFTLAAGSLPGGFSLSAAGVLSGTPLISTAVRFLVRATDTLDPAFFGVLSCTLTVNPPFQVSRSLNSNGSTTITGTCVPGTNIYYELSVDTTGYLTISVTPSEATGYLPQLTLYGNAGQLLIDADAGNTADATASLNQHLQPGNYVLAIGASNALPGAFVLASNFTPGLPAFQPLPAGGVAPYSVATGDFTGDGNLDLVTANAGANSVSVFLGLGDGTFAPAVSYPVGIEPTSVAVGDFIGDGKLDIVTTDYFENTVSVLIGNGDGTFSPDPYSSPGLPPGTFSIQDAAGNGLGPYSVAVGTFVQDGNLDIVTANAGNNTVSILAGLGNGDFAPAFTEPVGSVPASVTVGAFTRNGYEGIATANLGDNTVSVLLGDGAGGFSPDPSSSPGLSPGTFAVGNAPRSVVAASVTSDGNLDLITADSDASVNGFGEGTVSVLLGDGAGSFSPEPSSSPGLPPGTFVVGFDGPVSVAAADLNNGQIDLVTANEFASTVSVLDGHGDGTFSAPVSYQVGVTPLSVAVGDFGNNGVLDIVSANEGVNTVSVLPGRGDGTFVAPASYHVGDFPHSVADGVFTSDGNLDIVTADNGENPGAVSVLLGNGDGTFAPDPNSPSGLPSGTFPVDGFPFFVTVGHLSRDGDADIVTTNGQSVSVLLGLGNGGFLPFTSYPTTPDNVAVYVAFDGSSLPNAALGDFTGDGLDDVVTADPYLYDLDSGKFEGGAVSVLVGRGDGTFASAVTYPVGNDAVFVAVGDLTGDGNQDIVVANEADNTVSVLLGNGDGTFRPDPYSSPGLPAGTFAVGDLPVSVAVGDLTGNGHLDIVTANEGTNTVSVLMGDGNGNFQQAVSYSVGSGPASVVLGKLTANGQLEPTSDNNGPLDIVTANSGDNTVSVLLNGGSGRFQPAVSYPVGEVPDTVVLGDFNHDGTLDIVTGNNGDNTVSVLVGEGNGQFQTSTPRTTIAALNVPVMTEFAGDSAPDTLILNNSGELLFRRGLVGSADLFAPPMVINPGNPARDFSVFETPTGPAVASVDEAGDKVSIYTYSSADAEQPFALSATLPTGDYPVSIGAADLTGNGLGDLVVANDFDASVSIYLQTATGRFDAPITQPVGVGPSEITFLKVAGQGGPDIVVSDQISGDFTVLVNDATAFSPPTFDEENRYRAGAGVFDISINPDTDAQTVVSQLQTVGIATGDFAGSGNEDVIALNANAHSFTLVPVLESGQFGTPGNTYFTSAQPTQVVSLTVPGYALPSVTVDQTPSVAVLIANIGQIWFYRNLGNGEFQQPVKISLPAGTDPTGLSATTLNGTPALLVGNSHGDILTLLYDGHGSFTVDRTTLQLTPLAVGTIAETGQQFAVVADQQLDQVSLYYRIQGTDQFGSPVSVSGTNQLPLLAPGAVQTFYVGNDPNPYLAVADSLSNDILVYHFDPSTNQFVLSGAPYAVGDDPVSITVADLKGDGVPDLFVANEGSNDVSALIGSVANGRWTATPYQRISSGGGGPIAVAVVNTGSSNAPELLVTNSDGTVTVVPGIGSAGKGNGFFQASNTQTFPLGQAIVHSLFDSTTKQLYVVGSNGSVSEFTGTGFSTFIGQGVSTLGDFGDELVAGMTDGRIELLSAAGVEVASQPIAFRAQVSALQALQSGSDIDVFFTERGVELPFVVSFSLVPIAELSGLEISTTGAVVQGNSGPGLAFVLVATLLSGDLIEQSPNAAVAAPSEEVFALFLRPLQVPGIRNERESGVEVDEDIDELVPASARGAETSSESSVLGVRDALQQRLRMQQFNDQMEDMLEGLKKGVNDFLQSLPRPSTRSPEPTDDKLPQPQSLSSEEARDLVAYLNTELVAPSIACPAAEYETFTLTAALPPCAIPEDSKASDNSPSRSMQELHFFFLSAYLGWSLQVVDQPAPPHPPRQSGRQRSTTGDRKGRDWSHLS